MHALCTFFLACFLLLSFPFSAHADLVASSSDAAEAGPGSLELGEPEVYGPDFPMEVYALPDSAEALSVSASDIVNCVCYSVVISGTEYTLLFPSAYESSLMVDSDGYLWNVSGNSITGRLFSGSFSPMADTGTLLTLAPCLGNNFQANHEYGSPNYIRSYYWSTSDRLSYTTAYVTVQVTDTFHLYDSGHLLDYVMIFLIGCCLICLWKRRA